MWLPRGKPGWRRDGLEFGISRCRYQQINNRVLLYSTGNYIQYPVIKLVEKKMEKNHI